MTSVSQLACVACTATLVSLSTQRLSAHVAQQQEWMNEEWQHQEWMNEEWQKPEWMNEVLDVRSTETTECQLGRVGARVNEWSVADTASLVSLSTQRLSTHVTQQQEWMNEEWQQQQWMNEVLELQCTETTCIRSFRDSRNKVKCCLMSSDVSWHIRDKLWQMLKHGSINLYVHRNQKAY